MNAISTKRQKQILWAHYKIKRSGKNTSDSTSDVKCKDKGLISQYLALTKDGGEETQQEQSDFFFSEKSRSIFLSPYFKQ